MLTLLAAPASPQPRAGAAEPDGGLQVYAYTLRHQPVHEALAQIRDLLSEVGTVEVQPGGNTLVLRDDRAHIDHVVAALRSFDQPPRNLRFDIRIVRARIEGPPPPTGDRAGTAPKSGLSERLEQRLRTVLRYDDYQVLARAAVSSREREEVTYSLGDTYRVSFRPGAVVSNGAGQQRLRLEGFRIHRHLENPTNKGRRLEPEELFHGNVNLWVDRPFSLVLAQDEARHEALLIAISCRREDGGTEDTE